MSKSSTTITDFEATLFDAPTGRRRHFKGEESIPEFVRTTKEFRPSTIVESYTYYTKTKRKPNSKALSYHRLAQIAARLEPLHPSIPTFTVKEFTPMEKKYVGKRVNVAPYARLTLCNGMGKVVAEVEGFKPSTSGVVTSLSDTRNGVWVYWEGLGFAEVDKNDLTINEKEN